MVARPCTLDTATRLWNLQLDLGQRHEFCKVEFGGHRLGSFRKKVQLLHFPFKTLAYDSPLSTTIVKDPNSPASYRLSRKLEGIVAVFIEVRGCKQAPFL